MIKAEKIDRLRSLQEAYILYGVGTRLPFIECEERNYFDQAFIYEAKEEAEEAAKRFCENGDMVGAVQLKTVETSPDGKENEDEAGSRPLRNQVREHLLRLPLLGLNAVFFKPAGESGEVLELDQVIPNQAKAFIEQAKTDLIGVQLTGLYFAQCLRRKEPDMKKLREYSEEFHVNLARAELLMPVIPDVEQPEGGQLNLAESRIPSFPVKKKDTGEVSSFLALFTNMDEVAAYCKKLDGKAQVVKLPFKDAADIIQEPMVGCVIDPLSLCIPVAREDISRLAEAYKS